MSQVLTKKSQSAPAKSGSTKMIYYFGQTKTEGKSDQKQLLGGKGANLADMTSIGLPVPPGFTITTEVCTHYYRQGRSYPEGLRAEVEAAVRGLERQTGLTSAIKPP